MARKPLISVSSMFTSMKHYTFTVVLVIITNIITLSIKK